VVDEVLKVKYYSSKSSSTYFQFYLSESTKVLEFEYINVLLSIKVDHKTMNHFLVILVSTNKKDFCR